MDIHSLRKLSSNEEIDYPFLMKALSEYKQPRSKIKLFLQAGSLIRVKKGLYVFGEKARLGPFSKEILANLIYGPSAISLEYALAYYGLIPERVEIVTSITNNRIKNFQTPVGEFDYYYLSSKKYCCAITQIEISTSRHFLIAQKEKALADLLMIKTPLIKIKKDLLQHLFENLRIDENALYEFDPHLLEKIASIYRNHNVNLFLKIIKK